MLKEIQCDKFISYGNIRPAIEFHNGLNTILGSESGSNSIGKSTFLMIIDFVFGGEDYIEKSTDVHDNVEIHTINFTFEFNDVLYYFSRSTGDYTVVNKCNNKYEPIETISIAKFRDILSKFYDLELPGLSLRSAVSRFFRVYKRENLQETRPLHTFKKETDKSAIEGLLQLFNKYGQVAEQSKIAETAKDEEITFKKAQKYNYIPVVTTKTAYKSNEERIEILKKQAEQLANKSSQGLLDLNSLQAEQLAILKQNYSNFSRQKTRLESQIKAVTFDKEFGKKSFQRNYADLEQFFPEINIQRLESIEAFHKQLSNILKKEFKENEENIQSMLDLVNTELKKIEEEIIKINKTPNLSKSILTQYSAIDKDLRDLIASNTNFEKTAELHERTKKLEDRLNQLVLQQIAILQEELNAKMRELNRFIYDGKKTAPILTIQDAKHYSFFTPNDSGTGSQYKGLIVFDIAALDLTNLPALVHDSVLLKQIEDEAVEKILELYSKTSKQIFIALDKEGSYTPKAQEILNQSEVLRLSLGGNELFGRSWNETKK